MTALAFVVKNWRWFAAGLLVVALVVSGLYIRDAFSERDRLRQDNTLLTEQLKSAASMQQMTNQITEAISQIKNRSQVNVSRIERQPKPVFVDARPLPFIAGGVLQDLYSSAAAPDRAASGAAPGGALPAGQPSGRVLSR